MPNRSTQYQDEKDEWIMQIRTSLFAAVLCTSGTLASADTLLGQVPIGLSGTFTVTLTNCSVATTGTATYVKNTVTGLVTIRFPVLQCTSSAASTQLLGIPTELAPLEPFSLPVIVNTAAGEVPGRLLGGMTGAGFTLSAFNGTTYANFPTGASKGLGGTVWGATVTYLGAPDSGP
jgi:hypothetical protein